MTLGIVILAIALHGDPATSQPVDPQLDQQCVLAEELIAGGEVAEAEAAYRAILAKSPTLPRAIHGLGKLLFEQGKFAEAGALLAQIPNGDPDVIILRAKLSLLAGNWDDATKLLDSRLASDEAAAKLLAAARARKLDDELRMEITLIGLPHGPRSILAARAWRLFDSGRALESRTQFESAIGNDESDPSAWAGYGLCELQFGSPEKSLEYFQYAINLDGNCIDAFAGMAQANVRLGKPEEAVALWEQMVARFPGANVGVTSLAQFYLDQGEFEKALPLFERLAAALPNDEQIKHCLATAREAVKKK